MGHGVGLMVPSLGQKLPAGHAAQVAEEFAPTAEENEPFAHMVGLNILVEAQ